MPDKSHEESTVGLCSLIVCESIQSVHISMVLLRNLLVIWCKIRDLAFDFFVNGRYVCIHSDT